MNVQPISANTQQYQSFNGSYKIKVMGDKNFAKEFLPFSINNYDLAENPQMATKLRIKFRKLINLIKNDQERKMETYLKPGVVGSRGCGYEMFQGLLGAEVDNHKNIIHMLNDFTVNPQILNLNNKDDLLKRNSILNKLKKIINSEDVDKNTKLHLLDKYLNPKFRPCNKNGEFVPFIDENINNELRFSRDLYQLRFRSA